MQIPDLRRNHEGTDERAEWAIWTGAAVGTAAVLGAAGYLTWRLTRKQTVTERMRDRAEQALEALRR